MKRACAFLGILLALINFSSCGQKEEGNSFTGLVEGRVFSIASPVSDRLVELYIEEGDFVEAGQVLGKIDSASLKLQRQSLLAKKDQISLQLDELALTMAQLKESWQFYHSLYEKNRDLLKVDAVSEQSVQELKLNADKWERDLAAAKLREQALRRQRDELDFSLEELALMVEKADLSAPASGYIDRLFYEKGEFVPGLRPVAQLISLEKVWCYLYLGESALAEIRPGLEVEARLGDRRFKARIEHINSRAEFTPTEVLTDENRASLAYAVRVRIENPEGVLKIGMPVEIHWRDTE
ncbi:efflux RND transporter periplasmic adaptor subunit [Marispirochaeta aestuarii]|uniref:HlyD family secretion protein n=1 Tax=Marispirochaeta aestuarii TaxID=1963862 RepID=UPI0029C96E6A|nr:efflux RND transporter periplasmic adaptor subunit [Marispirochaeta aestuarii]